MTLARRTVLHGLAVFPVAVAFKVRKVRRYPRAYPAGWSR